MYRPTSGIRASRRLAFSAHKGLRCARAAPSNGPCAGGLLGFRGLRGYQSFYFYRMEPGRILGLEVAAASQPDCSRHVLLPDLHVKIYISFNL
jgi:hypothetical protein